MKVALCLSGQLRTFKHCFPSIKSSILDPYQPDVFFATDPNMYYEASIGKGINQGTLAEAMEMYHPKVVIKVDETHPLLNQIDKNILLPRKVDSTNLDRFLNDLLKRYNVGLFCRLFSEQFNIKYDVVIRARFDTEINQLLPINIEEGIMIPTEQDWLGGINDQLAWGNAEKMFWYFDMIKYIEQYTKNGTPVHPELMLKQHLEQGSVSIARTPINYRIIR